MASRDELQQLRQEAVKARRLMMQKRNRLVKRLGVESLGKYEPRLPDLKKLGNYNSRQLQSFLGQSEQFRSRTTQFVALGNNRAIPASRWRAVDREQRTRQKQQRKAFDSIKDLKIDFLGQTIGERRDMISPPRARLMENNMWMEDNLRKPSQFPSERALDRFGKRMREQNSGREQQRARDKAMQSLDKMFPMLSDARGGADLAKEIRSLTDDEFYALWNIRDTALAIKAWYESEQLLMGDSMSAGKQNAISQVADDYAGELRGLVGSVKGRVPRSGGRF